MITKRKMFKYLKKASATFNDKNETINKEQIKDEANLSVWYFERG